MSRSWNFVGLSEDAKNFLKANVHAEEFEVTNLSSQEVVNRYRVSTGVPSGRVVDPWYDEPYELLRYDLIAGGYVYEYVQAEPWSSGPVTFLALAYDIDGEHPVPESLWAEDEIEFA